MASYSGMNHRRRDGRPVTWMGCPPRNSTIPMTTDEAKFHRPVGPNGPDLGQLWRRTGGPQGHNKDQLEQVHIDLRRMRYTADGEGCRILKCLEHGHMTNYERPGPDYVPFGSAQNALEAANSNQYYPHMPYQVLKADMKCGADFPYDKIKSVRPDTPDLEPAGAGMEFATGFEAFALNRELFQAVLEYLPHTDRARLFQVSATIAWGVNNTHCLWTVNDENLLNAEFTEDELKTMKESGDKFAVDEVRGARYLTITKAWGSKYSDEFAQRSIGHNRRMGLGHLRIFRGLDNWGSTVRTLCLKHLPFVDHKVAAAMLEACPNIMRFEFIGCGTTSYLDITRLLGKIEEVQARRGTRIHFDAAPVFHKGCKWEDYLSDKCGESVYRHKGAFGVTSTDPGVDLGPALLKRIVYDLGPAAKAAKQEHMLYDLTSLCRQSLEAHPLPKFSITLMLTAWEQLQKVTALAAPYKKEWEQEQAESGNPDNRRFGIRHWPEELQEIATRFLCLFHWCAVRACFGENGYKQTKDRGHYSSDFQCNVDTYKEFTAYLICDWCGHSLPRLFYNYANTCEGCRMESAIREARDHLENYVRDAARALGYRTGGKDLTFPHYLTDKEQSNFPYEAFAPAADGQSPFNTKKQFVNILLGAPKLERFFFVVERIDWEEKRAGFCRSRVNSSQKENEFATVPFPYTWRGEADACSAYRRTLTHEEFDETEGRGWSPANGVQWCPW